jgi:hypothetical protein
MVDFDDMVLNERRDGRADRGAADERPGADDCRSGATRRLAVVRIG